MFRFTLGGISGTKLFCVMFERVSLEYTRDASLCVVVET